MLDDADAMPALQTHIMSNFLRLRELTGVNVCPIFIAPSLSRLVDRGSDVQPVHIFFPTLSKDQIVEVRCYRAVLTRQCDFHPRWRALLPENAYYGIRVVVVVVVVPVTVTGSVCLWVFLVRHAL